MAEKSASELRAELAAIDSRLEEIRQLLGPVMHKADETGDDWQLLPQDEREDLEREAASLREKRERVALDYQIAYQNELDQQHLDELRRHELDEEPPP